MPSQTARLGEIRRILNEYKDLFVDSRQDLLASVSQNHFSEPAELGTIVKGIEYLVPKHVKVDAADGIELRGNIGFISIMETWKNNIRAEYVYRFVSTQYDCTTVFKNDNSSSTSSFGFHYDLAPKHGNHLTNLMHPGLRHMSGDISLKDFLDFVRLHFENMMRTAGAEPMLWHQRL